MPWSTKEPTAIEIAPDNWDSSACAHATVRLVAHNTVNEAQTRNDR
jgi:hypothetical protein